MASSEGREGTSEIGKRELGSRVIAKMKSLDKTIRAQAKAIEKLEEKNAAMEKKLVELSAAAAQLEKPDQGSSFMQSRETDGAAAIDEKTAELTAAAAAMPKTPPFKTTRGPVSTRSGRGRDLELIFFFLVTLVFLIILLIILPNNLRISLRIYAV